MGAPDILASLTALGVRLYRDGDAIVAEPRSALTDDARAMIRAHKAELLAELTRHDSTAYSVGFVGDPPPHPATEARRQRVLAMLANHPESRRAFLTDTDADPEAVILALAIRDAVHEGSTVTCELRIPREKYDPWLLLELVKRHGLTVH